MVLDIAENRIGDGQLPSLEASFYFLIFYLSFSFEISTNFLWRSRKAHTSFMVTATLSTLHVDISMVV